MSTKIFMDTWTLGQLLVGGMRGHLYFLACAGITEFSDLCLTFMLFYFKAQYAQGGAFACFFPFTYHSLLNHIPCGHWDAALGRLQAANETAVLDPVEAFSFFV